MKIEKIKKQNSQTFLEDLKKATSFLAYAEKTDHYYNITKKDLISSAETKRIDYFTIEDISGHIMIVR